MSDGDNFNQVVLPFAVNDEIGEPLKKIATRSAKISWPSLRSFDNLFDGKVQLGEKSFGGRNTVFGVPLVGRNSFRGSFGMEFNAMKRHRDRRESFVLLPSTESF